MSEAVIVSVGRTPIGRAVKGKLIDQRPEGRAMIVERVS
jgi:acetyl-CoA acetyltransferase